MNTLQKLLFEGEMNILEMSHEDMVDRANSLSEIKDSMLKEGLIDDHNGPLEKQFDEVFQRLQAAKRGLGLANKLETPQERKFHKARVMGNMNKIRHMLYNIQKTLGLEENPNEQRGVVDNNPTRQRPWTAANQNRPAPTAAQ